MIKRYPNKILLNPAKEIDLKNNIIMNKFMIKAIPHFQDGIGIAGAQVGLNYSIFAMKIKTVWKIIMNPKIVKKYGTRVKLMEGCLSIPKRVYEIERYTHIDVEYYNADWEFIEQRFTHLEAQIFQHEYDHLQGILINSKR
jgi:peptide deformylase